MGAPSLFPPEATTPAEVPKTPPAEAPKRKAPEPPKRRPGVITLDDFEASPWGRDDEEGP